MAGTSYFENIAVAQIAESLEPAQGWSSEKSGESAAGETVEYQAAATSATSEKASWLGDRRGEGLMKHTIVFTGIGICPRFLCHHCEYDFTDDLFPGPDENGVAVFESAEAIEGKLASMNCPHCGRGD